MRELSVAEQRYQAVLAVIKDGRTVTEVAAAVGVSRQTLHVWLGKYEADCLEGLVAVRTVRADSRGRCRQRWRWRWEARRKHPSWGPQRIAVELGRGGISTS